MGACPPLDRAISARRAGGAAMTFEESRELARTLDRGRAAVMEAAAKGEIAPEDVARLRRDIFGDGFITREEADALFALERATNAKCPAWTSFLVEAITDHIVWQSRPTGVVNEAQGEWLVARADEAASLNGLRRAGQRDRRGAPRSAVVSRRCALPRRARMDRRGRGAGRLVSLQSPASR